MLSKGQLINDRYEIIKSIGEGGMANVYLAKDNILERNVAIKVLRGDLSNDEKFIRRFQREALSVSNLSHQNIVEVYDVGEDNGQHYIVMEYIEGKTLKQLLYKRGALTLPEVIDIMSQLTDGLSHAHDAYIIHRDIKPQNIMILDNGTVKITDFGIAMAVNATQFTQTNSVMGTVHYLPPEQANGKSSTVKSDIYSLGILMYELLTGSVPFKGDNAVEIALKHMKEGIPSIRKQNPLIPQSVENIVLKSCAKNPRNRYDNVKEMYNDLKEAMSKENEKKYIYEYPENDLDETKVIQTNNKPKKVVEKPSNIDTDEIAKVVVTEDSKGKNKIIIALSTILVLFVVIALVFVVVLSGKKVEDIKVPDVSNKTVEEAIEILEEKGFKYTTKEANNVDVEEGYVISTTPKAGSTRKKGTTVTIIESIGGEYYKLEDLTGKNYVEVKAKLELLGIHVLIEKKEVENKEEYKGKESEILDQSPKFNEEEVIKLEKGDEITLYIPDIIDVYPDMVAEKWTLVDAQAFADEYGITLDIREVESEEGPGTVLYQNRPAGDPIIKGITLKINIAKAKEEKEPVDDLLPGGNNNGQDDKNTNN